MSDCAREAAPPAAILLHPADTVATALEAIHDGDRVRVRQPAGSPGADGGELGLPVLEARGAIPTFHKIAILPHAPGDPVVKYGEVIGIASAAILPGEHVHTHNLHSPRGDNRGAGSP